MGKRMFMTTAHGQTVEVAFDAAREQAREEAGEPEKTGTIAEKTDYEVIPEEEYAGQRRERFAKQMLLASDERVKSKDGPAGAIEVTDVEPGREYRRTHDTALGDEVWLFFGWADMER